MEKEEEEVVGPEKQVLGVSPHRAQKRGFLKPFFFLALRNFARTRGMYSFLNMPILHLSRSIQEEGAQTKIHCARKQKKSFLLPPRAIQKTSTVITH